VLLGFHIPPYRRSKLLRVIILTATQALYALYKQALQDPPIEKAAAPGMFDLKGKAKYNAWKKVADEGVTPEEAQTKYVELVERMKTEYGYDESKAPEAVGGN
jgi:diazepam-binding inhibitor (GABA receptor modulating acyl-CoA-binding protein)